jgi:4'-phosphopantetheinyl transferase
VGTRVAPSDAEVHLWRAALDVSSRTAVELTRSLSSDERRRSQRARRESDRSRSASARGWLRQLLAGYLDVDPGELLFGSDSDGKLRLHRPEVPWLRFNLSHSASTVVFAVACRREVGVDVEQVRRDFPIDAAARRFLSAREQQDLAGLQSDRRIDAFFATWTRREAYLKGIGVGIGQAEQRVEIPVSWSVIAFEAGDGFAAAVAVQGHDVQVPGVARPLTLT